MVFEKSLKDFIRGLRANKNQEKKYIQKAILECKYEVKSLDLNIKTMAILKLAYLTMFGYDMSWTSFNIIEVMSSSIFFQKRIGYMASCLSFRKDTDVLMLCTNLIKKVDLMSSNYIDIGVAINALSEITTPELSRDLLYDLCSMMNHSNPYIRKRVVLVMYRIFLQYPDALRSTFPKICEKLEDTDESVVSATVNVICELSMKNPKNYLQLAPILYKLLKTTSNNWILMKLIKIFSSMIPLEPRLIKKLLPFLTTLIQNTSAVSLRYECMNIIIFGNFLKNDSDSDMLTNSFVSKLRTFFQNTDYNLKYIGLSILSKVMVNYPTLVLEFEDIILEHLDDDDIDIRLQSLNLIECLVNKENLSEIVKYLMTQLLLPLDSLPKYYRSCVVEKILLVSSKDSYVNISDFEWYISVLAKLVKISKVNVYEILGVEMRNVSVRVVSSRPYAVSLFSRLLCDVDLIDSIYDPESNIGVLSFVAWIVGEYSSLLDSYYEVLENMLQPKVLNFPSNIKKFYIQAIPKVFINWMLKQITYWDMEKKIESLVWIQKIFFFLDKFCTSNDLDVSQRAIEFREVFRITQSVVEFSNFDSSFDDTNGSLNNFSNASYLMSFFTEVLFRMFSDNLNPVALKVQKKIPLLEDINLDDWIYSPPSLRFDYDSIFVDDESLVQKNIESFSNNFSSSEYLLQVKKSEKFRDDPFYISGDISSCPSISLEDKSEINIPIVRLEIPNILQTRRKVKQKNIHEDIVFKSVDIISDEVPENMIISDSENDNPGYLLSNKFSKSILQVDSTALQKFSMNEEERSIELLNKIEKTKKSLNNSRICENRKKYNKRKDKEKNVSNGLLKELKGYLYADSE
ncbi:uncharacterized protein T551_00816 [Pneumocystis jirovecii RU7]|uniref:AP-3 complex subunit delta n=1 Tax=Pneumocystis jirovecii (strain RU7) TaxID=1408657 RepID=A0A0W4ZUR7_PNEJ7|nr:uncharacterized protein T551_00816 [Pneumocystis jirovecii RU7]KTW32134.1 hypothetical protein T551_00816 [Pneumocystis jirovecii RU7]